MNQNLLLDSWSELQRPGEVIWQVAALLLCLALAWFADHLFRKRRQKTGIPENYRRELSERWLQRLIFPLTALALVWIAQPLVGKFHNSSILALAQPLLASLAAIRMVFFALSQGIPRAQWLSSFEKFFSIFVWSILALHLTGLLPELIKLLDSTTFGLGSQKLTLWTILQGVGAVLLGLLIALWVGGLVESRILATEGIDSNLRAVFARLSRALLLVLAVLISLPLVGIDLTMLSVFGSALGVGLGFGLQKIAANYISGFIILLDHSVRMGSLIEVGNQRGVVTRITTRYTVLRNRNGLEMIVPNEMLVSSIIINETYTDSKVRIPLPVQVAYGTDLEKVQAILIETALAQPRVLTDPAPKAHVLAFADSGINVELRIWIADPDEGTGQVKSDVNLAIWKAFQKEGIEIPYPQREVRFLKD